MEWSYGLLAAREQVLMNRLSVFAGSFSLEAAEAVCAGEPLETEDILDGVSALVDKSLVSAEQTEAGETRYFLLESVWDYARAKLTSTEEGNAVRTRHLAYYLRLAEEAEPKLTGREQAEWLEQLAVDHGLAGGRKVRRARGHRLLESRSTVICQ
jgi:non-specific serine/threonine protein kinase